MGTSVENRTLIDELVAAEQAAIFGPSTSMAPPLTNWTDEATSNGTEFFLALPTAAVTVASNEEDANLTDFIFAPTTVIEPNVTTNGTLPQKIFSYIDTHQWLLWLIVGLAAAVVVGIVCAIVAWIVRNKKRMIERTEPAVSAAVYDPDSVVGWPRWMCSCCPRGSRSGRQPLENEPSVERSTSKSRPSQGAAVAPPRRLPPLQRSPPSTTTTLRSSWEYLSPNRMPLEPAVNIVIVEGIPQMEIVERRPLPPPPHMTAAGHANSGNVKKKKH